MRSMIYYPSASGVSYSTPYLPTLVLRSETAFPQRAASSRSKSISNRVLTPRRKCSPMAYGSDSSSCYVELVFHVNVAHCEWDILIHVLSPWWILRPHGLDV